MFVQRSQWFGIVVFIAILLAACSPATSQNVLDTPVPSSNETTDETTSSVDASLDPSAAVTTGPADDAVDDVPAAEAAAVIAPTPLPGNLDGVTFIEDDREYVIRQLIPRDGIRPIYEPQFTSAEESGYADDELVMGLEINGDARAYAVGIMRSREIANDVVGGTPVLVTW
ncbi:MAG: DUF3179 domain-containing protein [Chloroflexi bacterium]|nr:MAG: DUF3179 domain-containing protein [Chloroflexota bacterium]